MICLLELFNYEVYYFILTFTVQYSLNHQLWAKELLAELAGWFCNLHILAGKNNLLLHTLWIHFERKKGIVRYCSCDKLFCSSPESNIVSEATSEPGKKGPVTSAPSVWGLQCTSPGISELLSNHCWAASPRYQVFGFQLDYIQTQLVVITSQVNSSRIVILVSANCSENKVNIINNVAIIDEKCFWMHDSNTPIFGLWIS